MSKSAIAGLVFSLLIGNTAAAGQFADAAQAYSRGDYETAMSLWLPLADEGDAVAQYNVGLMFHLGQGVPVDHAEAVSWYRRAAEQGDAGAQSNLGFIYAEGSDAVPQDEAEAARWYELAAEQDHPPAQFSLGNMYAMGRGVERDVGRALEWLARAEENECTTGMTVTSISARLN